MKRYASLRFARTFDRLRRLQQVHGTMAEIEQLLDLGGIRVVELGAGTGVMTQALASRAAWVDAFDRSAPMLAFAEESLRRLGVTNCSFTLADHHRVPLPDRSADLVFSAWALDSVVHDRLEESWHARLDGVVAEMLRLSAPLGTVAIVASPCHRRQDHLRRLEVEHGFRRRVFKSVWRFDSRRTAKAALELFFQREVWRRYRPHWPKDFVTLAGIWWRGCARRSRGWRG